MIQVEVTADTPLLESILGAFRNQLPFAESVAINNVLNDAQAAIRRTLPEHFVRRQPEFIDRTIYIGPSDRARKDRLVGTVRVNPDRDFLAKFEEGGEKIAQRGRSLAVPVIRATDKSLIIRRGDALSVANLMQAIEKEQPVRIKQRRRKGDPKRLIRAPAQQGSVYLVKGRKGTLILQRTGTQTRVLYAFERQVPIAPVLHFEDTALDAVLANWDKRVDEAIAYAIETAR